MGTTALFFIINLCVPGFALHRNGHALLALGIGFILLTLWTILFWQRWVFDLTGFLVGIGLTLATVVGGLVHLVSFSKHPRRQPNWFAAAAHICMASLLYSGVLLNAKSWLGFEFHYVPSESMAPNITAQDVLLSDTSVKAITNSDVNDVLVFVDPANTQRLLMKRLAYSSDEGLFLLGDNARRSHDSRHFGKIEPRQVKAVARWIVGRWDNEGFSFAWRAIPNPTPPSANKDIY